MRGTLGGDGTIRLLGGIIPAYAGNTHMELWNKARVRDHPRVCGEHHTPSEALVLLAWIIPAYAGNT